MFCVLHKSFMLKFELDIYHWMELVGLPTGKTIKEELLLFLAIIYMYLCIYLLYVHEYFC